MTAPPSPSTLMAGTASRVLGMDLGVARGVPTVAGWSCAGVEVAGGDVGVCAATVGEIVSRVRGVASVSEGRGGNEDVTASEKVFAKHSVGIVSLRSSD